MVALKITDIKLLLKICNFFLPSSKNRFAILSITSNKVSNYNSKFLFFEEEKQPWKNKKHLAKRWSSKGGGKSLCILLQLSSSQGESILMVGIYLRSQKDIYLEKVENKKLFYWSCSSINFDIPRKSWE